jgi:hypothetical protein
MSRARRVTGWRKLAGASWRAPADPQFFGSMDVDAAALQAYAQTVREHTGAHVTMTHLIGRAVAHALQNVPALRQRIVRGREYDRESVDVFFIITTDGGRELTGVKIEHADAKSATDIAVELDRRRGAIQEGSDPEFGRTKRMLETLPRPLLRAGIRMSAWLTSDLNVNLPRLGLPRQAFGGAMVTSVGMWGIANAYSPLAAYYRVPVLVLVGAVESRPVARAGCVVVRPMLTVTATFDHRYVDGYQAAQFAAAIREYCVDPACYEPPFVQVDRLPTRPAKESPAA